MLRLLTVCCYIACILALGCAEAAQGTDVKSYLYKIGNNSNWSSVALKDDDWLPVYDGLPEEQTIYWARSHIHVDTKVSPGPIGVYSAVLGAYELYWDGKLLTKSGIIGHNSQSETPGPLFKITRIPDTWYTDGEHVISMKISSFHSPDKLRTRYFAIRLQAYEELLFARYQQNLPPVMILGGLLIIALYYLQLYLLYSRDPPLLLFSLLCFAVSALLITESYKGLFGYTYQWHHLRLILVSIFTYLVSLLLPLFFSHQFNLRHKNIMVLTMAPILLIIAIWVPGYDFSSEVMFALAFVSALIIALYAWRKQKQGALLAVAGLLTVILTKVLIPYSFQDSLFFPSFGVLILFVLTALTLRMKITQKERDEALTNSAQLEIMLLKKNIQPHFILNTLTSIEQWIEEEPQTAVRFIDALADEFRVMNEMADHKQVPLSQELNLCHSHLQIMSYRKDMTFELTTKDINPELPIPPAIIHTLIENALTHNLYLQGKITLILTQTSEASGTRLELKAPLNLPKKARKPNDSTGTGLKYIKSRLEESYPDQWTMHETQTSEHWITQITFRNNT